MKRILKIIGLFLLVLLLAVFIYGWVQNESLPEGNTGTEADSLAQKMLVALNHEAYLNTRYLEWSFRNGAAKYSWDKEMGICLVQWKDFEVTLDLNSTKNSSATKERITLKGEEKQKAVDKALDYFNNDSFWLVAPYKVFDAGTERRIVSLENDEKGLLVTYTSGGSTPGDSYLWLLNENGFPNSYKMWTSVIPVGGVAATWDDWLVTETGAYLPKTHKMGPFNFSMGDVKGYNE